MPERFNGINPVRDFRSRNRCTRPRCTAPEIASSLLAPGRTPTAAVGNDDRGLMRKLAQKIINYLRKFAL